MLKRNRWTICLMLAWLAVGAAGAAQVTVKEPVTVELSEKNWTIIGLIIFTAMGAGLLVAGKLADALLAAGLLRTLQDQKVKKAIAEAVEVLIKKHDDDETAHRVLIKKHDDDSSAHFRMVTLEKGLAMERAEKRDEKFATRVELNGAIQRLEERMNTGFELLRRDIHALDPSKFVDDDDDGDSSMTRRRRG